MTDDAQGPSWPDAHLATRARAGDGRALDELVRRHHAAVYRTVRGILRDEDRAADATQETFIKAMRGLGKFRGEARFRTWILTIAVNEARGALRRHGRRRERALDEVGPLSDGKGDPADRAIQRFEVQRVRACLERLPDKQRLAVTLRVFEGLSFREVGDAIGSSEGAARVNYFHGIRRLRGMLE